MFAVTEHVSRSPGHTTFYLACGAPKAPLIVFAHGWPELGHSWRHQLPCFAALGFRCIAPDMRGYGRSTIHPDHADYAVERSVEDMLQLIDALGYERAVWVGHDWGSPVVWSLASHHPERCHGIANLCVPYIAKGFSIENLLPLIDRTLYPEGEYPWGQWEYMRFYQDRFDAARSAFEANVENTVKALFRAGNPSARGKPSRTALVYRDGGWFGGTGQAPDLPRDASVLSPEDLCVYAAALQRTGFFGPDSWYKNHARNAAYAARSVKDGKLDLPVLFLHAAHDFTCDTVGSRLAEPMRRDCTDLTEMTVESGHWMAQERPVAVNAALATWLARRLPKVWPA
jgi:pimeloyl-ACP methyl ester carboxylesterase